MNINERLISEVNGSMAIEGMALTKADRERMIRYLEKPEDFGRIMKEILLKYQTAEKDHA
ncbi:MAG: hypothetical protein K5876_05000 [Ruminiclostridium sp.]|nr:hypothetical protein [Ruminiclostridium sp.]